jgi:uncharacterized membrane protein
MADEREYYELRKAEELRMLFQVSIEDIRYTKRQQWNTIYLTLLAVGSVIALFLNLKSSDLLSQCSLVASFLVWLLKSLVIIVPLLGIYFMRTYFLDLLKYRCKKDQYIKTFSKEARDIHNSESASYKDSICKHIERRDASIFTLIFCVVLALAGLLGCLIIFGSI